MFRKITIPIVALIVGGFIGYTIAWNQTTVINTLLAAGEFILPIVAGILLMLSVFWPKRWPEGLRLLPVLIVFGSAFNGSIRSILLTNVFWVIVGMALVVVTNSIIRTRRGRRSNPHPVKTTTTSTSNSKAAANQS